MAITTRGDKPAAADAILFAASSTNISKPTTELEDSGYATQARPGSANYNWLFNYVSAGIAHEFVYGIAEYDSGETYVANSYTNRLGLIYRSRTAGNTGNSPESSPDEWHDIRQPLTFTLDTTGTHNPQSLFDEMIELDTSLGNISITLGPGGYTGQKLTVYASGSGIADLSGTGLYTNNVFYTSNTGKHTTEWDGSAWRHSAGITADNVSGSQRVIQYSHGFMEIELSISDTTDSSTSNYWGTSSGTTYFVNAGDNIFAKSFSATPKMLQGHASSQVRGARSSGISSTASGQIVIYTGATNSVPVDVDLLFKGDY